MSTIKDTVDKLLKLDAEAIKDGPFHVVSGDAAMRMQPHSNICVNTNSSWLVSNGDQRSRHKLTKTAEFYNEVETMMAIIKELNARIEWTKDNLEMFSWDINVALPLESLDLTIPFKGYR